MSLTRTTCPECGAGLKSAAGFNPGQQVRCPKCSTAFAVPEPEPEFEAVEDEPAPARKGPPARAARADDDDRPRRKRRPRDDDDEDDDDDDDDDDRPRKKGKKKGGYKNSPLRYAILGVLLVVMGVLAFMLYQKKMREKEDSNAAAPAVTDGDERPPEFRPAPGPRPGPADGGGLVVAKADDFRPTGDGPTGAAMTRGNNDLKRVMLAMHNHHDTTGAFPKAAVTGPDGKALLSWRVAILPFVEQAELYKQFKLTEPWDSPANRPLLAQMPKLYQGTLPANDGKTAFKVFVGGGSAFDLRQGRPLAGVTDGASNTFGVVESGRPVEWTKPEDIPFDGKAPPRLVAPTGGDVVLVGMLDGSTRRLNVTQNDPAELLKAVTAAGGEPVELR